MAGFFSDYSIAIILVLLLLLILNRSNINAKNYIVIATSILTILAFFVNPVNGYINHGCYIDLYRYYRDMDVFAQYGWNASELQLRTAYSTMPIVKILVFLVAQTGIYGLLPAFVCIVSHLSVGGTLLLVSKDYNLSSRYTKYAFCLFILMNNYGNLISNARMPMGMCLFFSILYLESTKRLKFRYCFVGYVLLCLIHNIFIVFVGFRLIVFFFNKYSKVAVVAISVAGGLSLKIGSIVLPSVANAYMYLIQDKIEFYQRESVSGHVDYLYTLLAFLRLVVLIYSLFIADKELENDGIVSLIYKYSFVLLFFMIGSFWNFHLFTRIGNFCLYFDVFFILLIEGNRFNLKGSRYKLSVMHLTKYRAIYLLVVLYSVLYLCLSHNYRMYWF